MSVLGTGVVYSLIGALKLELAKALEIDDQKVGGLISALMLSSFFVILFVGPLVDLFGHKPLAIAGFCIGFASILLLLSVKLYTLAIFSCLFLGIGGMCLNTVGNTLLPIIFFGGNNPPAALNLGTAFYGLGAVITPLLIGMFSTRIGYKITGSIIAVIILIPVTFCIFASYPQMTGEFLFSKALRLLTDGMIISASIAFFCYLGLEVSMASWITTYGNSLDFSDKGANMLLCSFWLSLIISRLIASALITSEIGIKTIAILAILSFIITVLISITKSKTTAAGMIILTGLIFGPIFPTIIGVALSKTDMALRGSAFAIIFAFGLLGASVIPLAIGIYSKTKTIQKSLRIAMIVSLVLFVMSCLMEGS
jgi:fucose permease